MTAPLRITLAALLLATASAPSAADSAADAVSLARTVYYEGIPREAVLALDDAGIARLVEMLADPSEAAHHGSAALILGMSGHPDAFDALARYAAEPATGEVDRATFRARTRVPRAMGHLARRDPRALGWLLRRARRGATEPRWSFRHHRGERLRTLLEEQTLSGLALSGAPEARAEILRARDRATGADPGALRRRRHAERAAALHDRIARNGPDALPGGGPR